jgi:2-iminobutanoate/2-iminopropanoate deaminase
VHIHVFLLHMSDFDAMNRAYVEVMGDYRPARTAIGVADLPKPGVLVTMNLTAVTRS